MMGISSGMAMARVIPWVWIFEIYCAMVEMVGSLD